MYLKTVSTLKDVSEEVKESQDSVNEELEKQKKQGNLAHIERLNEKIYLPNIEDLSIYDYQLKLVNNCKNVYEPQENKMVDNKCIAKVKTVNTSKYQENKYNNTEHPLNFLYNSESKAISQAINNETEQQKFKESSSQRKQKSGTRAKGTAVQTKKSIQLPPGVKSRSKVFKNKRKEKMFYSPRCVNHLNITNGNKEQGKHLHELLTKKETDTLIPTKKSSDIIKSVIPEMTGDKQFSDIENCQAQDDNLCKQINGESLYSGANIPLEVELSPNSLVGISTTTNVNNINSLFAPYISTPNYFTFNAEKCRTELRKTNPSALYNYYNKYLNEVIKQKLTNLNILKGNALSNNAKHSRFSKYKRKVHVPKSRLNPRINKRGAKKILNPLEVSSQQGSDIQISMTEKFNSKLSRATTKFAKNSVGSGSEYQSTAQNWPYLTKTYDTFIQNPRRHYTRFCTNKEKRAIPEFNTGEPKNKGSLLPFLKTKTNLNEDTQGSKNNIAKKYSHPKCNRKLRKSKNQIYSDFSRATPNPINVFDSRFQQQYRAPEKKDGLKGGLNATTSKPVVDVTKKQQNNTEKNFIKYVEFLENSLEYNMDLKNNTTVRVPIPKYVETPPKRGEYLHTTPRDDSEACLAFENNLLKKEEYIQTTPRYDYLTRSFNTCRSHSSYKKHKKSNKSCHSNLLNVLDHGSSNKCSTTETAVNITEYDSPKNNNNNDASKLNKGMCVSYAPTMDSNTSSFHMQLPIYKDSYDLNRSKIAINPRLNTTTTQISPIFYDATDKCISQILYKNCDLSLQNQSSHRHIIKPKFVCNPLWNFGINHFDNNNSGNLSKSLPEQPNYTESKQLDNLNSRQYCYAENIVRNIRPEVCDDHFSCNNLDSSKLSSFPCMCNTYSRCQENLPNNMKTSQFPCLNNTQIKSSQIMNRNLISDNSTSNTYSTYSPDMFENIHLSSFNTTNSVYSQLTARTPILNPTNNAYPYDTPITTSNIFGPGQLLFHQRNDMNLQQSSSVACSSNIELNTSTSNLLNVRRPITEHFVGQLLQTGKSNSSSPINSLLSSNSNDVVPSSYSRPKVNTENTEGKEPEDDAR